MKGTEKNALPRHRTGLLRVDKGLLLKPKLAAATEQRLVVEITEDALCSWLKAFGVRHGAAAEAMTRWSPGDPVGALPTR